MPSKTQHKIQFARNRGVIVQYVPFRFKHLTDHSGWYVFDDREWFNGDQLITSAPTKLENIYGPFKSKREAKNVAYALALKGQKL